MLDILYHHVYYIVRMNIKEYRKERNDTLVKKYMSGNVKVESLAIEYGISTRAIQRIAKEYGVVRTVSEANKNSAKLKNYYRKPEHLKVKRKCLSNKLRYTLFEAHPYCKMCGLTVKEGIRLEVDHIDNNPQNNELVNLQVLCNICNSGKYQASKLTHLEAK